MTNRPKLVPLGGRLVPGVLAVALFGVLAAVALTAGFDDQWAGFPEGVSITAAIGYALFDLGRLQAEQGVPGTEPFLVSFLLIAIVLDAALDASLVLAKREESGETPHPASYDQPVAGGAGTTATAAADGGREGAASESSEADPDSAIDGEADADGGERP